MKICWIVILYSGVILSVAFSGTIVKIDTSSNQPAVKGINIRLVCYISQFSSQDGVHIYKTDSRVLTGSLPPSLTVCIPSQCLTTTIGRYTFSSDSSNVYVNITNVNRSEDQKWWTCVLDNQRKDLQLTVYTVPKTLQLVSPPNQDQDLSENAVTLTCRTDCTYPKPSLKWFYTELGGLRKEWSTPGSDTETTGNCTDSEKIYTSTLSLAKYSTFPGNLNKTVKFTCGIPTFTGMTQPLYSNPSVNIQFAVVKIDTRNSQPAVKGTNIQLVCYISQFSDQDVVNIYKTDSRVLTGSLPPSLTQCIPSVCLTTSIGRYTFSSDSSQVYVNITNLNRSEDQKWWTCVIGSQRKDLQLTVYTVPKTLQLISPPNQDQDLSENAVTLTCRTDCTYPKPSLKWFYTESGGLRKEWSTPGFDSETTGGCTESEMVYTSTLSLARYSTFPGNLNKIVSFSCGIPSFTGMTQPLYTNPSANIQFPVYATIPTITNQTAGKLVMMENDSVSMECISSLTRPAAIVTWRKGTQILSNVQNINSTVTGGLTYVRSIVTFTPVRNDDNEIIYCETAIPGHQNKSVAQQRITVYWPPSAPSISTNDFPFLEGQSGKTLSCSSIEYGNPTSSASWDSSYGTQDSSDSKILNLPTLNRDIDKSKVSCQLKNHFTQAKGLAVTSPTVIMDVQYKPVVRIVEAGHDVQTVTKIEGQNFTATCIAVGNPIPTVRWIGQSSAGSELRFTDLDRKDHGTYTCRAEATSEKYPQYDFVTLRNLSLVVFYTTVQSFYIEEHADQDNVTVDEHDPEIEFKCIVNSNTASTIVIMFEGGILKQEMNVTSLSFTRQDISCSDAGAYTCEGRNDYGGTSLKPVFLSVRCVPRPKGQIRRNLTSEIYSSVTFSFTAIAYPEPGSKGFAWQKEESLGWVPLLSNDHLKISTSGLQSNLTVLNVSEEDYGTYRLTVTNNIGNYVQHLFLSEDTSTQQPDRQCKSQTSYQTTLAVGISLGMVCCVLASVATYLAIRMRTITKEARSLRQTKKQSTYANTSFVTDVTGRHEYENPATDQEESSNQQQYTALCRDQNTDKNTYDVISKV